MSYSFQPMTEKEIDEAILVEEGTYDFEVLDSIRRTSKKGNPMAELHLKIWDKNGHMRIIYDYLVFSPIPLNIRKVKHFCDATGLQEEYKQGQIPEDLNGLCGTLSLGTQEEQPNGKGSFFPKKNVVNDYILSDKEKVQSSPSNKTQKDSDLDDDIPF